jgi:hypothetical protein
MKTITLSAIAASIVLAMPVYADDAHHPEPGKAQTAQAQPDGKTVQKMQDNLGRMRTQLERLAKAKTDDERQKIMGEHMQTMQENMGMARGMQSGMMGCPMMQGGMGMMGGQGGMGMMGGQGGMGMMGEGMAGGDMMSKRMDMMERRMDMMQMMMQGRMGLQPGEPPKPAN